MKKFVTFLLDRSKERSSWVGLTAFLSAVGLALSPEQQEAIIVAGVAVAGLISVFTKD